VPQIVLGLFPIEWVKLANECVEELLGTGDSHVGMGSPKWY
jgi:hypothetical protein